MPTAAQIDDWQGAIELPGSSRQPRQSNGHYAEPGRLAEIAHACKRHRLWFVSDEIYHGLTYGMAEQRRSPTPTRRW